MNEGEKMIEFIDSNSDRLSTPDDLNITDVNLVTFLIKVRFGIAVFVCLQIVFLSVPSRSAAEFRRNEGVREVCLRQGLHADREFAASAVQRFSAVDFATHGVG